MTPRPSVVLTAIWRRAAHAACAQPTARSPMLLMTLQRSDGFTTSNNGTLDSHSPSISRCRRSCAQSRFVASVRFARINRPESRDSLTFVPDHPRGMNGS